MAAFLTALASVGSQLGEAKEEVRQEREARAEKQHRMSAEDAYLELARQGERRQKEEMEFRRKAGDLIQFPDGRMWSVSQGKFIETSKIDPMVTAKRVLDGLDPRIKARAQNDLQTRIEAEPYKPQDVLKEWLKSVESMQQHLETEDAAERRAHSITETDTTTTVTIDTPEGPKVFKIPKKTVTKRGLQGDTSQLSSSQSKDRASQALAPYAPPGGQEVGFAKPTGSEMNRADLANNVEENLNSIEDIVKRRPDLFGPGRGVLTWMRGEIGTKDEDIASLFQIRDNLGRALQGAHGMRAARGVLDAGNSVLNSFRNGPKAVLAAIQRARGSVKTFERDVQKGGQQNDNPLGIDLNAPDQ